MERERNYHEGTFDWVKLLGEDVVRTMDEERNRKLYQRVMEQKEGRLKPLYRLFDSVDERVEWKDMQGEFCVFYRGVILCGDIFSEIGGRLRGREGCPFAQRV